jgi:hypothetical protein
MNFFFIFFNYFFIVDKTFALAADSPVISKIFESLLGSKQILLMAPRFDSFILADQKIANRLCDNVVH